MDLLNSHMNEVDFKHEYEQFKSATSSVEFSSALERDHPWLGYAITTFR